MEIYTYLLYSGGILIFLSVFYWFLLRKETFFQANRWVLIGNIALALLIPLIPAPSAVSQLKQDLIVSFFPETNEETPLSQPNEIEQDIVFKKDTTTLTDINISTDTKTVLADSAEVPFTISTLLKWIYLIGFGIMLFRFLTQVFYVYKQIKKSDITKGAGYYLATNNKDISPFSFWKYIVVNPNKYDESSFLHILEHERIHVLQRHTIDLVLAELFLIIQWCNPLAWWHRHWVDQNLEFLVDQTLLDNGENKKSYQYHLVQVAVPNNPLSISSNYNSSQLKKRIKMMNLQRSSLAAIWKYALLLPMAFLLLVGFTATPNETDNSVELSDNSYKKAISSSYVIITEDATEEDLKNLQDKLYEFGYLLSFDKLIYEDNKITELEVMLDYNNQTNIKIPASWDKDTPSPKVTMFTNEVGSRFGNFSLDEIMVKDLEYRIPKEEIFIAGNFSLSTVLSKMKAQIKVHQQEKEKAFQKNIKDDNWEGKLSKWGLLYATDVTNKNISHIKDLIQKKGYPTTYYLDGIKNDEAILDIPVIDMEKLEFHELRYRKFNKEGKFIGTTSWNYEVKIKRKGKKKPTLKELNITPLDEVYIILTEEADVGDIQEIQEELLKYDIELVVNASVHNDADRIVHLGVELKEEGVRKVMHTWTEAREGYKFMVLYKDWKNDKIGAGYDDELLMKARNVNKNGKLFFSGNKNSDELNLFPSKQTDNAKNTTDIKEETNNKSEENLQKNGQQKPQKKGFHYFEACDCYIPKTFSPSTKGAKFIIEGNDLSKKSSFHLFNKWGEEVYKAEPYQNDWKGLTIYEEKIKLGTFFFTFQAEEGLEVVNGFLKIIDEEQEEKLKNATDFIHFPEESHYVITQTTLEDLDATADYIKPSLFMMGQHKKRYSSIFLDDNKTQPLFIIREFENFQNAQSIAKNMNQFQDKPKSLNFISISKSNYQVMIRQKSLMKYVQFYQNIKSKE